MRLIHNLPREGMDHVNLQHPNWTGRAYRSAREAFGFGLEWPGYDNRPMNRHDIAGIACGCLLVAVVTVCGLAGVFA